MYKKRAFDGDISKLYLGNIIKEARRKKKMTQLELGNRTDLSRGFICDMEKGKYIPSGINLLKICKELDLDINTVLI